MRPIRLVLPPLACLVLAGACDKIPLPKRADGRAVLESLPPVPSAAQRAKPTSAVQGDAALDAARFDRIRLALRRLVEAEETFFAENGIYTDDLSRLNYTSDGESELRFLWATRGGWAARGSHPGVPGRDCVIYVGLERPAPATLKDRRVGKPGVPVCDLPPTVHTAQAPRPPASAGPRPPSAEPPAEPEPPGQATEAAADTSSALDAVNPSVQMRVDLRNLVRSQDTYFAMQGVYSKHTEPFALQYGWHHGVTIKILSATADAWSARATHAGRAGKSCVIWLGPVAQRPATEAERRVPDQPATPICDD
jgi:hypothetical protein